MSQSTPQDPDWVSLPFAKFSHNTSPVGTRNFIWNHVGARNDLDYVVRNVRMVDDNGNYASRVVMRLTAGAETLELQDLGELVQVSRAHDPSSGVEPPVQVVIRTPFLAMRYPQSGQVPGASEPLSSRKYCVTACETARRIQLKFNNDQDFTQAWHVLKDLGLPITQSASNAPTPRATPAPGVSSSPLPSTRYSPALSMVSVATRTVETPATTSSNSNTEFKLPARPESSHSSDRQLQPYTTSQVSRPPATTMLARMPSFPDITPLPEAMTQLPSFYVAQLEREMQAQRHTIQERIPENDRVLTTSPFFSAQQPANQTALMPSSHFVTPHERMNSPPESDPFTSQPIEIRHTQDTENSASQGPLGYATTMEMYDNIRNGVIPPRRELLFSRPSSAPKERSTSATDLPPLPKPTRVSRAESEISQKVASSKVLATLAPKPAKKRVAQRKGPAAKAVEKQLVAVTEGLPDEEPPVVNSKGASKAGTGDSQEEKPSPLAANCAAASSWPGSVVSVPPPKATTAKKRAAPARPASAAKRAKMVDQSTQTQAYSGPDQTTAMVVAMTGRTPHPSPVANPSAVPPEAYFATIDACIAQNMHRPPPQELWQTSSYTDADEEQRHAMVLDFICENLESEPFLKLCQDVGNAWQIQLIGM